MPLPGRVRHTGSYYPWRTEEQERFLQCIFSVEVWASAEEDRGVTGLNTVLVRCSERLSAELKLHLMSPQASMSQLCAQGSIQPSMPAQPWV